MHDGDDCDRFWHNDMPPDPWKKSPFWLKLRIKTQKQLVLQRLGRQEQQRGSEEKEEASEREGWENEEKVDDDRVGEENHG